MQSSSYDDWYELDDSKAYPPSIRAASGGVQVAYGYPQPGQVSPGFIPHSLQYMPTPSTFTPATRIHTHQGVPSGFAVAGNERLNSDWGHSRLTQSGSTTVPRGFGLSAIQSLHDPPSSSRRLSTQRGATADGRQRSTAPAPMGGSVSRPWSPTPIPSPRLKHCCEPNCDWSFSKRSDLFRHLKSVHRKGENLNFCCRCGHRNSRKDNYLRHLVACKTDEIKGDYECSCGIRHVNKDAHTQHLSDVHGR
jgi:hypothetical protein